jgi:hypothetical protein
MVERNSSFLKPSGFEDMLSDVKRRIAQLRAKAKSITTNFPKSFG